MKKTNKKNTIKYIVDITNSFDEVDVILAFAKAKLENNIVPNVVELNTMFDTLEYSIVEYIIHPLFNGGEYNCIATINGNVVKGTAAKMDINTTKKKPNVFKRFWNWITRK